MNQFYDISMENQEPTLYQLRHLGNQSHVMSVGSYKGREDFGRRRSEWQHLYRPTTSEDYDKEFAYRISKIKPPYTLFVFLDYHFNDYLQRGNDPSIFLKHIKYVILPIMRKRAYAEEYIELVHDWTVQNAHIGDSNTFTVVQAKNVKVSQSTLKAELQKLIETNAIDKVLKRFLEAAKENHLDCAHELTLLSARFTNLNAEIRQGVLTKADERIERNQINAALTELMNRLEI